MSFKSISELIEEEMDGKYEVLRADHVSYTATTLEIERKLALWPFVVLYGSYAAMRSQQRDLTSEASWRIGDEI